METAAKSKTLCLLGEVSCTKEEVNFEQIARDAVNGIGFNAWDQGMNGTDMNVVQVIEAQDANIAASVHGGKSLEDIGAGDQGIMFGYATNEYDKKTLHPLSHQLSCRINEEMARQRKNGEIPWLRPDCKSQVIVEYKVGKNGENLEPVRIFNILISTQHAPEVDNETIRTTLIEKVCKKVCPNDLLKIGTPEECVYVINPSGKFDVGGPAADAGLTGRKIIVDSYGGWCPHGGGAYSGKDPTKVDRSGAYYARYVAKSLVNAGLCHRVCV